MDLSRKYFHHFNKANAVLADGVSAAWPICLGYIPIGLAFGVLAQKAGLSPLQIGLMSLFVFAGSAQFIAVSMLAAGAAWSAIVVTTFTVNLRHLLMSSSLAVFLQKAPKGLLSCFAYGVTDESFAVNIVRFTAGAWDIRRAMVVNQLSNAVWIASTVAGGYSGRFIPAGAFGMDYALIAMFICLLVFQLRGRRYVWTAVISGGLATLLSLLIPGNSHVILASAAAASVVVWLRK